KPFFNIKETRLPHLPSPNQLRGNGITEQVSKAEGYLRQSFSGLKKFNVNFHNLLLYSVFLVMYKILWL
ncbi:hypothetical protein, partial [Gluconobacter sphaericus]|uniref:hypothetical protein n=1 Tax=Gluconobacter sphaericus TaxID=574987 RepID=UPI001B8A8F2E